jgi:hypothetical protein
MNLNFFYYDVICVECIDDDVTEGILKLQCNYKPAIHTAFMSFISADYISILYKLGDRKTVGQSSH